jgi:hypothetical protein
VLAAALKSLEKRSVDAKKSNLAATAKRDGLREIGRDYSLDPEAAVKAQLLVRFTGTGSLLSGKEMTSESTGAIYVVNENVGSVAGYIEPTVTAKKAGDAANLLAGERMTLSSSEANVSDFGDVVSTVVQGAEEQTTEAYRRTVLAARRGAGGGGNSYDYRKRAEAVPGVLRAYPFSGKPIIWELESTLWKFEASTSRIVYVGIPGYTVYGQLGTLTTGDMLVVSGSDLNDGYYTVQNAYPDYISVQESLTDELAGANVLLKNASLPGDRTVFVESDDEEWNRVPLDDLLDAVRQGIEYDDDGTAWPDLGDVESTLYVERIERPLFFVEIIGFVADASQAEEIKGKVVYDLGKYFDSRIPFVTGLDFEADRTDKVTDVSVSKAVEGVLEAYGASAEEIVLRVGDPNNEPITAYAMGQHGVGLLGGVFDETGEEWTL